MLHQQIDEDKPATTKIWIISDSDHEEYRVFGSKRAAEAGKALWYLEMAAWAGLPADADADEIEGKLDRYLYEGTAELTA